MIDLDFPCHHCTVLVVLVDSDALAVGAVGSPGGLAIAVLACSLSLSSGRVSEPDPILLAAGSCSLNCVLMRRRVMSVQKKMNCMGVNEEGEVLLTGKQRRAHT
jgi:hypothetical protein